MAIKRKYDDDLSDNTDHSQITKQLKLVPFPSSEPDMDVEMFEGSHLNFDFNVFHSRLQSSASTASSDYASETASPVYPIFELYPANYSFSEPPSRASPMSSSCSTLQFMHARSDCTQIPKLRIACGSGPSGQRSMWSMCEECGAVQMMEV